MESEMSTVSVFYLYTGDHHDDVEVEFVIDVDERPETADPNSSYESFPVSCVRHLLDSNGKRVSTQKVRREHMLLVWADHLKEMESAAADEAADAAGLRSWSIV
jgi:hypothetical protein